MMLIPELAMQWRRASYTFILGTVCLLSACGFQLRGDAGTGGAALPEAWKNMHLVTGNPNSELSRAVQSAFAAGGVQWSGSDTAAYRLVLGPERFSMTNLSLNAEARVSELELNLQSRFEVQDKDGRAVMPATESSVIRQMENDPRNVVGKADEVQILKAEMRTELAHQILRRIGFYATRTP